MSRGIKIAGLAMVVVSLTALAAPAAQAELAPRWKVAGAFLGSGATKSYTATLTGAATLEVPGLMTLESSSCSVTGKIVGSAAKTESTHKESVLECKTIAVKGAPACEVTNIVTSKMKGQLGWMEATGESNVLTFEAESGSSLTTVLIEECALEGEYPVTGGTVATLTPTATEATEATLAAGGSDTKTTENWFTGKTIPECGREFMTSPALVFGGRTSKLTATFTLKLSPAEKFGGFAG